MDAGRVLDAVDGWQQRHRSSAFPVAVVKKFGDDRGGRLSALVAYYGFFSLFPLLLVFVSVLGFVLSGDERLRHDIVDSALGNFPVIGPQIRHNIGSLDGSVPAIAIGFVTASWAGLGVIRSVQEGFTQIWDVPRAERRSVFVRIGRASLFLLVLGGGVVCSAAATGLTTRLSLDWASRAGAVVVSVLLNFVLLIVAYRLLNAAHPSLREVAWGAAFAAGALSVLQAAGSVYVEREVATASSTYGTFAIVIGLLAWLLISAQIVFFGAEIAVVASRRLWPRSLTGRRRTDADRRVEARQVAEERREPAQDRESSCDRSGTSCPARATTPSRSRPR